MRTDPPGPNNPPTNRYHDMKGQMLEGAVGALFDGLFGTSSDADANYNREREAKREREEPPNAWTIREVIATDQFACVPVRDSAKMRYGVARWSIEIANNPFRAGWLFAMLRTTKSIAG
jgi:hypothetical protein